MHVKEPLESMKPRLNEERDEGEELDRKRVRTEMAETVEIELESHPQVHKKWTCSSDCMVAVCVCFYPLPCTYLGYSFRLVYRRRRNKRNACMNHQPPPSYLSMVLRPRPSPHLPLHTFLKTPLS